MPVDVLNALLQLLNELPSLQTLPVLQVLLVSIQLLTAQGLSSEEILAKLIQEIKPNGSSN
ncbi:MAG TPA: hypothetical protein VGZ69_01930 [Candidatus Rhabdochlamydia sp.]|nr:hypothetical protein [Candidatus Rhabdochlamydia sp.]